MIGLDYANERFVRAYVRDTEEFLALSWQAQSLYWAIRRKCDRSGLLQTRKGAVGVALILHWPREVVVEHLPELVAEGFVQDDARGFLLPEFIPSEETKPSDAQRQRESRARRQGKSQDPADRHEEQQDSDEENGTEPVQGRTTKANQVTAFTGVTNSDELRDQTAGRTSLRLSVPSVPSEEERRSRYEVARSVLSFFEQERRAIDPQARPSAQINAQDRIVLLLGQGHSEDDLMHVVRVYAHEARQRTEDRLRWFNAATVWGNPDNVERAKAKRLPAQQARPADGLREAGGAAVAPADADERARRRIAELDAEAEARRKAATR